MKRREFITLIGGAAVWPVAARAQQQSERMRRIGAVFAVGADELTSLPGRFLYSRERRSLEDPRSAFVFGVFGLGARI